MIQPTKWSVPLGSGADVQDLPNDDLKYASFSKIFPQITQVPLSAGGVAPRRIDFNSLFKLLADNIYYYQNGGVFEYSDTADYERGAVVKYNDNIYLCIQDNSALNKHAPTDSAYWSKIPPLSDFTEFGFNTGDFKPLTSNTIPSGWLLGNGAVVNRSICPNLVQFAYDNDLVRDSTEQTSYESDPTNFAGRIYGPGDGSTTIQIPNLRGRSLMGAFASTSVGRYVPEQLPNITGNFATKRTNGGESIIWSTGGAFSQDAPAGTTNTLSWSGSGQWVINHFNAHNSNAVYIDNGKIYPASIALNFIIKT